MQYYIVLTSDYMIPSLFTYVLLLRLHEYLHELLHNTLHPITCPITWFNMRLHDFFFNYMRFTFRITCIFTHGQRHGGACPGTRMGGARVRPSEVPFLQRPDASNAPQVFQVIRYEAIRKGSKQ